VIRGDSLNREEGPLSRKRREETEWPFSIWEADASGHEGHFWGKREAGNNVASNAKKSLHKREREGERPVQKGETEVTN